MRIGLIQSGQIFTPSPKGAATMLAALQTATVIGLDIETGFIGESPRNPDGSIDYRTLTPDIGEIKSIQICLPDLDVSGSVPVVQLLGEECHTGPMIDALLAHIQTPGKRTAIHNALYEGEWFLAKFDVHILNGFCTLVGHQMETAGLAGQIERVYKGSANSLKTVAERKLGILVNKELQVSDWSGEISREQSAYAMFDAYLTYKLYTKFQYLLASPAGQAEMAALPMFAYLNRMGMPADRRKLQELSTGYAAAIQRRYDYLLQMVDEHLANQPDLRETLIPKSCSKKERANWKFNIGSPNQVKPLINSMLAAVGREPITSTEASELERLDIPFAKQLSEYRSLVKLKGYVDTFLANYRESTGTVLCRYSVLAYRAASGRSSASDGSLQIVGNTSPVLARDGLGGPKTAFAHPRPERGNTKRHMAIKCDLPGSHSQLAGMFTKDQRVIHCLTHDEKIHYHTLVGMFTLMGIKTTFQEVKDWFTLPGHGGVRFVLPDGRELTDTEVKAFYTAAKNAFYSYLNFAGPKSLNQTFFKKGIRTTLEECRLFLDACKTMYPEIYKYQREMARWAESSLAAIYDIPEIDLDTRQVAHLWGAELSHRTASFLTKGVKRTMADGRVVHFPAFAAPIELPEGEIVDTADQVEWKSRPANMVATQWLSAEATIMKSVGARLLREFPPEWEASIRAFAHDEVVIWVREDYVVDACQLYMDIVTEEFRRFVPFFQPESPSVMENWEKVAQTS